MTVTGRAGFFPKLQHAHPGAAQACNPFVLMPQVPASFKVPSGSLPHQVLQQCWHPRGHWHSLNTFLVVTAKEELMAVVGGGRDAVHYHTVCRTFTPDAASLAPNTSSAMGKKSHSGGKPGFPCQGNQGTQNTSFYHQKSCPQLDLVSLSYNSSYLGG